MNDYEEYDDRVAAPGASPAVIVAVSAVAAVAVVWGYLAEFRRLWEVWGQDPNYSHGYFVPLVAALIVWRRKPFDPRNASAPWQWGWLLVVASLAARYYFYENGRLWAATVTLLPLLIGLTLALGGWGLFRAAWPGVVYLVFMIPLPNQLNSLLAQPLQTIATDASAWVLQLSGLWVIVEGNVIFVGRQPLNVAEACNGMSMMMSLLATVTAAVLLLPTPLWVRLTLLFSALPVALLSNVIRVAATGWCVHRLGAETGAKLGHDAAGWLMMPLALFLVGLEVLFLLWLISEEMVAHEPMLLGEPITHQRSSDRAPLDAPDAEGLPGPGLPGRGLLS